MMQCPTCKREINSETSCPRCGANLSEINGLIKMAGQYINKGKKYLNKRDFKSALAGFKTAHSLYHTPEAEKGIVVSLVCLGRYKKAIQAAFKNGYFKKI